ncbi:MAG TPA: nitrile hydratase subunit alpha [Solirubrobacter sp.]|nr:nitrile hydratase subunit alpha [Solirubrobacter sp.]
MAHEHDHDHDSELSETQLRVRALESVLVEGGYVDPAALDALIETYETRVGPHNGAQVVARAWSDPAYRARLFDDATAAIAELGYAGRQGEHMVALENTRDEHHMVVCTLCSCYPWPVLGLPPVWYKSAPYRSRAVSEPRAVLADFGVTPCPRTCRSASGTRPPRCAIWSSRCARRGPTAGARSGWRRSSRATR